MVGTAFVAGCQSVLDAVTNVRSKQAEVLTQLDGLSVIDSLIDGLRTVIRDERESRGLDGA